MDKHYNPYLNAQITDAVIRYCGELNEMKVEISARTASGSGTIRFPATPDRMARLWDLFHMDRLDELNGRYCRMGMSPSGYAECIADIMDDRCRPVYDEDAGEHLEE